LDFTDVPVVIRSIDEDPWVPKERVEETAEYFVAAGGRVDSRIDKGTEHGITEEAVNAGKVLLASL
jgi:predicted esterase